VLLRQQVPLPKRPQDTLIGIELAHTIGQVRSLPPSGLTPEGSDSINQLWLTLTCLSGDEAGSLCLDDMFLPGHQFFLPPQPRSYVLLVNDPISGTWKLLNTEANSNKD
jgi:hypothetical protein